MVTDTPRLHVVNHKARISLSDYRLAHNVMLNTTITIMTTLTSPAFTVQPARSPHDVAATAALFRQYHRWLNVDLSYQGFEAELASLPGKYAPAMGGELLLARLSPSNDPIGCIALRDISGVVADYRKKNGDGVHRDGKIAEVKRLYTQPAARGLGVGTALVEAVMDVARREGYDECRLDTLPRMTGAIKLYSRVGFVEAEKYYDTDLEGTIFMRCVLK